MLIGIGRQKGLDPSDGGKAEKKRDGPPDQESGALDQIRPNHGFQSPDRGVESGNNSDDPHGGSQVHPKDRVQGQAPRIENRGDGHPYIDEHGVKSHDRTRQGAVTIFQKFRDGIDSAL